MAPSTLPPVSIVIPFRNEESNLEPLIASLSKLEYANKIEIVLINDNSDDRSVEIVKSLIKTCNHTISLFDLPIDTKSNLTSKQQAIDLGIKNALYDTIIFTDADMIFDIQWLTLLGEKIASGADLVFGRTSIIVSNKGIFQFLQAFQLDFLFATAYTFFHSGISGSCMGNNMALRRGKYIESGGFDKIGYSITEDRALFARFRKLHFKIGITDPFYASAKTYPCVNVNQFLNQMKRWALGGLSNQSILLPIGLIFAFQNITVCIAICGVLKGIPLLLSIANFLLTWVFTAMCFKQIRSEISPRYFPLFFILLLVEVVVFTISSLINPSVNWKGRALQK